MLLKNQASSIISTYTADVSGVCSALFELGGMCIIHDPSGCNSTYNTHDEPRWYDYDSLIFISGLTQLEAIMGDDTKLIDDIVDSANELNPKFIAVAGSPIPMIMGTDFNAIAKIVSEKTGIPCFGFPTNGMHSYISGAGMAFSAIAETMSEMCVSKTQHSINILGTTPLDFSINGYTDDLRKYIINNGYTIVSEFGMNGNLNNIKNAGKASVNIVVSSSGLRAAQSLNNKFGTPYVVGMPAKDYDISAHIKESEFNKTNIIPKGMFSATSDILVIGDAVYCNTLSHLYFNKYSTTVHAVCPPDTPKELIQDGMEVFEGETPISDTIRNKKVVIADPLFKPLCSKDCKFIPSPHEAFSGRMFRNDIKNLLSNNII